MKEEVRPKLSVVAMGFSWGAFIFVLIFIISVWCSLTGFGYEFLKFFNTINPNPFQVVYSFDLSAWSNFTSNILGILVNSFYAIVDGIIMGLLLGFFYNLSLKFMEKKEVEVTEEDEGKTKDTTE